MHGSPTRPPRRSPSLAIAGICTATLLIGGGTAAAAGWIDAFQSTALVPIAFEPGDLAALPDVSEFGDVDVRGGGLRTVAGKAEAADATGLALPNVASLPRGIIDEPEVRVAERVDATLTFDTDAAAAAGLAGVQLEFSAGPGVATVWPSATGLPALFVGRAVVPTVTSEGAELDAVRERLVELPGMTDEMTALLEGYADDGSTLPLPVPSGAVESAQRIGDREATILTTSDATASVVLWVESGVVTVVAGTLDRDELISIAEELS